MGIEQSFNEGTCRVLMTKELLEVDILPGNHPWVPEGFGWIWNGWTGICTWGIWGDFIIIIIISIIIIVIVIVIVIIITDPPTLFVLNTNTFAIMWSLWYWIFTVVYHLELTCPYQLSGTDVGWTVYAACRFGTETNKREKCFTNHGELGTPPKS